MKRASVLAAITLLLSFSPGIAEAHALIPQALIDYVTTHPNATPQQIENYAQTAAPEFAVQYQNGAKIIELAKNQQTNVWDNAIDFFRLGVNHILSGPDHILFVLSLLLLFASVYEILKLVSSFTVAHSITLALSALGILTVSPRISEPLIALSIVYVAITSVWFADNKYLGHNKFSKPASVFFFGLFHGLGFAGLLREIQIPPDKFLVSLFSFNVGIEIGQLIIIACALPLLYLAKDRPWYPLAIKIAGTIIAALAFVWVIQRTFFPV